MNGFFQKCSFVALLFSLLSYICTALGLNLDFLAEWGIAIISPHCILKSTPNVGVFLTSCLSTAPHSTSKTSEKRGITKPNYLGRDRNPITEDTNQWRATTRRALPTTPNHLWNLMFLPKVHHRLNIIWLTKPVLTVYATRSQAGSTQTVSATPTNPGRERSQNLISSST